MSERREAPSPSDASRGSPASRPGLPSRIDVRRAFEVYVYGRDRTLAPTQKREAVPERSTAEASGPDTLATVDHPALPVSVTVPLALRFDRSAGTWRKPLEPSDTGGM